MSVTVRSHRDGAGRVWEKRARKVRHFDCTPHVERARREHQIEEVKRDIAIYEEMCAEWPEKAGKIAERMIVPLRLKIVALESHSFSR